MNKQGYGLDRKGNGNRVIDVKPNSSPC